MKNFARVRALGAVAALCALAVALVAAAGWIFNAPSLTRIAPHAGPMAPSTAASVALLAVALAAAGFAPAAAAAVPAARVRRVLSVVLAVPVAVGSLVTFASWIAGMESPYDDVIAAALGHGDAIRTAATTAAALLSQALAILCIDWRARSRARTRLRRAVHPAELLALASLLIGAPSFGEYLYGGTQDASAEIPALRTALSSGVAILALALAVLAARPNRGVMSLVMSELLGGVAARRFLIAALGIPLWGMGVVAGQRGDLYGPEFSAALFSAGAFSITIAILFTTAASLNRVDAELRRSRAAVEESEARARSVFENAADGIFIADNDGRYLDVNRAGCELLGRERGDIVGRRMGDFTADPDPARIAAVRALLERGDTAVVVWHVQRADGPVIDVEVRVQRLPDGRTHVLGRDVTARRRAEEEAARARAWLSAVLDQMPEGAILLRADGTVQANRAGQRFARPATDDDPMTATTTTGERVVTVIRRPGASAALGVDELPVMRGLRGERVEGEELELVMPDGSAVPVIASASSVVDADGAVMGAVALFRDVTPLKEIARLREEWTSVVAHDLRQPITVVQLSVSALAKQRLDERGRHVLERLRVATAAVDRMIEDLLDASRIDAKRMKLQCARHDLVRLVASIVDRLRAVIPGHAVRVRAPPAHEVPLEAAVDPMRLEQILVNLVSNAARYGAPSAPIEVSLAREDAQAVIAVTNSGETISPAEIARLFQRFHRLHGDGGGAGDRGARGETRGIGLGLYIVKGLVEAHGGTVAVRSGGGVTTFFVRLPAATIAPADSAAIVR